MIPADKKPDPVALLLPCPHCGEQEHLYPAYRLDKDGKPVQPPYAIDCIGCGHDFTPRDGMDARAAWNRRASPSQAEPANPAQVTDAMVERAWRALVSDNPTNITITKADLSRATDTARPEEGWHEFKNFHRLLCERFGYCHDEKDWRRDQVSLIEHIAARVSARPLNSGEVDDVRELLRMIDNVQSRPRHESIYGIYNPTSPMAKQVEKVRAAHSTPEGWRHDCATEGCGKPASVHFIRGGISSYYCHDCYLKVQALPTSPKQETNASKGGQSE